MTGRSLARLLDALTSVERTFVTSVPDKGLAAPLAAIDRDPRFLHVPCTREEEAVGLCAGAAFAGRRGVLVMQNSGIGNAVNGLTSLVAFYQLPLLILVSMRGGPGERISAQLPMGRATRDILAACGMRMLEPATSGAFVEAAAADPDGRLAILASPDDWARLSA
jgi:sulfopyruvate decarboxylase subunit alpha